MGSFRLMQHLRSFVYFRLSKSFILDSGNALKEILEYELLADPAKFIINLLVFA